MRFAMIFEGIDRATKVMGKIMAAEKKATTSAVAGSQKTAAATDKVTRATERQAGVLSRIGSAGRAAYNGVVAGANAAARATVALHQKTVALAKAGLGQVGAGAGKAFRGVALAAGIAVSAFGGAAVAAGSLVGVASQFEKFQTILETTEGSSAKAKTAMAWVSNFAAKTPYELDGVMESFVQLRSRGLDPTNGLLKALGDTSAAMGVPLMQGVEAMADAVTGENERLKEFGITASKTGNKIAYTYTNSAGKQMTASVKATDRMAIQQKLMAIFSEKYGGAMEKLSATWEGMVSNLADIWSQFQLAIMNAGLFDWMKDKLKFVLDTVNQMAADGTLKLWAEDISTRIMAVLQAAWDFAKGTWEVMKTLGVYLKMASDHVGGWENLAMILAGMAFAPVLISTAAGIVQIAMGLTMLSTALFANPIGLAIAAIAAAAFAIYANWEPIKAFFVDLWSSITAGASAAWNAVTETVSTVFRGIVAVASSAWDSLKTLLAWHPAIMIVANWSEISGAVSAALDAGLSAAMGVWDRMKALFSWSPVESIKVAWGDIGGAVSSYLSDVTGRATAAWERVKSVFSFGGGETASVSVADPSTVLAASAAAEKLEADMQRIAAIDTTSAMGRMSALQQAAGDVLTSVITLLRQAQAIMASVSFYDQGAALMDTMAAGIRARAQVAVTEIARVAQMMRDHLPSSPAKVGPLSDIHRLKFGETIAQSIRPDPMVKAMRAAAAATMGAAAVTAPAVATTATGADAVRAQVASAAVQSAAASGSGGNMTLEYKPTVTLPPGTPENLKADFAKMLDDHSRHIAKLMDEEDRRRARTKV